MISILWPFLTYEKTEYSNAEKSGGRPTDSIWMQKVETLPLGPIWTSNDPLYLITVPMRKL